MNKIAILGIENSHAWGFARTLAPKEGEMRHKDMKLVGLYTDLTREDGRVGKTEIGKVSTCTRFAKMPDEFAGEVDAVMITARHGKHHLPFAKPYLQQGIPVWVDKPICTDTADAVEMVKLAKEYGSPISGGSCLVFSKEILEMAEYVKNHRSEITGGYVEGPVNMVNDYGNFWFYSAHVIQMITSVFGFDVHSVEAWKEDEQTVRAVYHYSDMDVKALFGGDYAVTVYREDQVSKHVPVTLDGCFDAELDDFCRVIRTGKGVASWKEFVMPVFMIDATIRAFEENREVKIELPEM